MRAADRRLREHLRNGGRGTAMQLAKALKVTSQVMRRSIRELRTTGDIAIVGEGERTTPGKGPMPPVYAASWRLLHEREGGPIVNQAIASAPPLWWVWHPAGQGGSEHGMKSLAGTLAAPFPYFGGKALACETVWAAFGVVDNYVEPFAGSAAMLLGAPEGKRVETINDADGFVANFWRAVAHDAAAVAQYADWPTNEADLFARHSWLVRQRDSMLERLHADPAWYDAKIAGWWCWGSCNWIGSGWCSGTGPWVHDGEGIVDSRQLPHLGDAGRGINRKLPHLGDAGRGINRKLPHLGNAGRGINRKLPHLGNAGQGASAARSAFIHEWFAKLQVRMRDVRVACGDWARVVKDSVTTRHGLTAVFLDPPYTKGAMDYAAGGVGGELASEVREWCAKNGRDNKALRIVLCGHAGEHDALLQHGWHIREWTARKGYATTEEAVENSASETLWCSPHCVQQVPVMGDLFSEVTA